MMPIIEWPMVFILVLNWMGWKDTIECLESLQQLKYKRFRLILIDNCSMDDSIEQIKRWANGEILVNSEFITDDLSKKPIVVVEYDQDTAENGGISDLEIQLNEHNNQMHMVLIRTDSNLGYAGGNNVGIKYALKGEADYVWVLNNDTVVAPNSLEEMVKRALIDRSIGVCGSSLLYYDRPDIIQALGGAKYNKWLATTKNLYSFEKYHRVKKNIEPKRIEEKMSYVSGASMLVRRQFLEDVGPMCEDYFLYFEEIDWMIRARRKYTTAFALNALVYHKEGSTIGTNLNPNDRTPFADYYFNRNKIIFTKKHFPGALPFVYFGLIIAFINRIRRHQISEAKTIVKLLVSGGKYNFL